MLDVNVMDMQINAFMNNKRILKIDWYANVNITQLALIVANACHFTMISLGHLLLNLTPKNANVSILTNNIHYNWI